MNIFKTTTFTWWQVGLLKWAVLFVGIVIGAEWPTQMLPYAPEFLIITLLFSAYLCVVWFRQR